MTPVERLAVSTLRREGAMPLPALAKLVASDLYVDALRHGAWVIDIGVFGRDIFVPDVARELKAADGILWEIETPDGAR
jgi:hypothetical protein